MLARSRYRGVRPRRTNLILIRVWRETGSRASARAATCRGNGECNGTLASTFARLSHRLRAVGQQFLQREASDRLDEVAIEPGVARLGA
jgi:hypothetical protein